MPVRGRCSKRLDAAPAAPPRKALLLLITHALSFPFLVCPSSAPSKTTGGNPTSAAVADAAALQRYRDILDLIRARGMRVMLTLHHHSTPRWAIQLGGCARASS